MPTSNGEASDLPDDQWRCSDVEPGLTNHFQSAFESAAKGVERADVDGRRWLQRRIVSDATCEGVFQGLFGVVAL